MNKLHTYREQIMDSRYCAEKIYHFTEMQANKYLKRLGIFLGLLFLSLILQLTGDPANQHLIIEGIVRTSITSPFFVSIFIVICLTHVLSDKYLQNEESI